MAQEPVGLGRELPPFGGALVLLDSVFSKHGHAISQCNHSYRLPSHHGIGSLKDCYIASGAMAISEAVSFNSRRDAARKPSDEILRHKLFSLLGTSVSPAGDTQSGGYLCFGVERVGGLFANHGVADIDVPGILIGCDSIDCKAHFVGGDDAVRSAVDPDLALAVIQLLDVQGHAHKDTDVDIC